MKLTPAVTSSCPRPMKLSPWLVPLFFYSSVARMTHRFIFLTLSSQLLSQIFSLTNTRRSSLSHISGTSSTAQGCLLSKSAKRAFQVGEDQDRKYIEWGLVASNLEVIAHEAPAYSVVLEFLLPLAVPLLLFRADLR
ncbi:hypothetical protein CJ030_MR7G002275 [Morella rubra]|uniref:Uncharacterized protein n=1 Tax=Morella rubra TaxID=262757 RepID=A0A6A1V1Q6_9ROSI|nr:hypothetical protein CJ030_MR7G000001 [Morella rubra]KAB1206619.1 hypothetical protein CJ030_MR7G002275 [Morella rubra]